MLMFRKSLWHWKNVMTERKLLFSVTKKDLIVSWFSGSGGGGTHRNKHKNCCRIQHPDSGAMATGQEQRSRQQNIKAALHRLVKTTKFKIWHNKRSREEIEKIERRQTIEQMVEEQMAEENLKIEIKEDGKWTNESSASTA